MELELERFFSDQGVRAGTPLVVAVSGGPDSMALLHALAAGPRRADLRIGHVDHGLRPESAAEAACVTAYGAALGVPVSIRRLDVDRSAPGNLHARLRDARYAFLLGLVPEGGYLLTAHHADDQALTLLMRLIEGAALPGLAGMRPRRERILRPLLGVPRDALRAYVAVHGVPAQSDPSNDDEGRFRNRLRRRLWPLVLAERPQAARLLAESAAALREDDDALQELAERLLDGVLTGYSWAELPVPAGTPPAVLRRAVAAVLGGAFAAAAPSLTQWRAAQVRWRQGSAASLPGRVSVYPHGDTLLFLSDMPPATYGLDISGPGAYVLPTGELSVLQLPSPLRVRPAEPGDRLAAPRGPHGVFDRLAAAGVPAHRRRGWPVLTAAHSRDVIAVPLPGEEAGGEWGRASFAERISRGRSGLKSAT
jgi:tRNA(Ile)-lysidine synthase